MMTKHASLIFTSIALLTAGCPADDVDSADTETSNGSSSTAGDTTDGTTTTGGSTDESSTTGDTEGGTDTTTGAVAATAFEVTIENVSQGSAVFGVAAFDTPEGADEPGVALPGNSYVVEFGAAPGHSLSFATMFVQSNDFFIAPPAAGIALFDKDGNPQIGDITDQLLIWDAGTEEDEEPGTGANQAPRQAGPNTGDDDDDATIRDATVQFADLPAISALVDVELEYDGQGVFTLSIENVSTMTTLEHSEGTSAVPLSPGVVVIHTSDATFFEDGGEASDGLEALAEDGDPAALAAEFEALESLAVPLAPGVFVVHTDEGPLFTAGEVDRGEGLEALAEDGDPSALAAVLGEAFDVAGVFNTPDGAEEPGPLLPGGTYSFQVEASEGELLNFATMFVLSNDLFYSPRAAGIALFDDAGEPISGDVTDQVSLWDAGTEDNQWPGAGPDQAPFQSGPDVGGSRSIPVDAVSDDFTYPSTDSVIRVMVTPVAE